MILRSLQGHHCHLWWTATRNLKGKIFLFYKYQTVLQEHLQCTEKGLFLHCNECTGSQFTRTLEWDSLKTIWIKFSITTQEIQASFSFLFIGHWVWKPEANLSSSPAWGEKLQNIIPWDIIYPGKYYNLFWVSLQRFSQRKTLKISLLKAVHIDLADWPHHAWEITKGCKILQRVRGVRGKLVRCFIFWTLPLLDTLPYHLVASNVHIRHCSTFGRLNKELQTK